MTSFFKMFSTGAKRETTPSVPSGKAIAMIVDDEPAIRGLMAMSLRQCGYHVVEASHGLAALAEAKRLERVDLLIADLDLAELPGEHVAANLRAAFTDVPVVFTTESGRRIGGADPVMRKPFACGALMRTVAETVGVIRTPARLVA